MKNLGLVLGFLPLIVYAILSGHTLENTEIAILACLVSVIVGFQRLKRGSYLDWANILMFAGAFISISVLHITVLLNYMNLVIYLVLAVMAFGSLLAGNPFTLPYAPSRTGGLVCSASGHARDR
jgi:hypothetical protein